RRHTRSDRDWSSDVCSSDLRFLALTVELRAEVVDDDLRAFRGQRHRDAAADAPPRPRDQCRPAVEHAHRQISLSKNSLLDLAARSEERRVGKECRARGETYV